MVEDDYPNLLFPVDGDIFDLAGKQCIVIGGAYSIDKFYRLRWGYPWWADEHPSEDTKAYIEQQIQRHPVNIVFSHTCLTGMNLLRRSCLASIRIRWIKARNSGLIKLIFAILRVLVLRTLAYQQGD